MTLTCLLALLPWTYRNYALYGKLMPVATMGTQSAPVSRSELERRGLTVSILRKAWEEPLLFACRIARDGRDARLPANSSFPRSLRDRVSALSFSGVGAAAIYAALTSRTRRPSMPALDVATTPEERA